MQTGPQNRFSFFDRRKPVLKDVVKMGVSPQILNTPFLNLTGLKPAKTAKPHKMNVLHRNIAKNPICSVSGRSSERASIFPVHLFLGMPGIVAEQNSVVLIGCDFALEPSVTAHVSSHKLIEEGIQ